MHPACRHFYSSRQSITSIVCRTARTLSKPPRIASLKAVTIPLGEKFTGDSGRKLLRAVGFTFAVSGTAFIGCAIWNYESVRKSLRDKVASLIPSFPRRSGVSWQDKIQAYWQDMSSGKRLVFALISANVVVFIMWQLRSLQPFMTKYFLSDPKAHRFGIPLLLSMFSHIAPFHLFCNMYVLWSFSDAALHMFGQEQFLFFYLSAGLFSGLLSLSNKLLRGIPQPSLGASGAIIAALAAVCTAFPDSKLSIIFLPMYPFSADTALKFLLAFESLGVLLKWRFFDHAAHLGGILFGIWYVKYGHKMTWAQRSGVVEWWHKIRGQDGPRR